MTGEVKLEFHDGETWTPISAATANDGVEPWTVPVGTFRNCRLRISPVGDGAAGDESDGTFSITARTPRLRGILLTNGVPVIQFDQEPGRSNQVQRATSLSMTSVWETVAVLNNKAQTVSYPDVSAVNLPGTFYRIVAR